MGTVTFAHTNSEDIEKNISTDSLFLPIQSRCYPGFLSSFSFPCFVSTLARLSVVVVWKNIILLGWSRLLLILGMLCAMTAVMREPAVVMALATSFVAIATGAVGGIAGVKGMSMMSMIWNVLRTMT